MASASDAVVVQLSESPTGPSAPKLPSVQAKLTMRKHKSDVALKVDKEKRKLRKSILSSPERCWRFVIGAIMLFCLVWIAVTTFAPAPVGLLTSNGTICPRPTVCAEEWYTIALLAVSRSSAYFTYPLMMLLFLSKTNHLRTILQNSWLSLLVPFHDLHSIHVYAGRVVAADVTVHALCHLLRWALQGNIAFLWSHVTGRSGFVSIAVTPFIALPMAHPKLRRRISWEARKALHYLSVAWGVSICFHAPQMHIAYLMGVPVGLYALDYAVGSFFRTFHIASSSFEHLECGVELTFAHPQNFRSNGTGYVLVCLPWISRHQWHAFSLFAHPTKPNHSCVCMNKGGDWTNELHETVRRPTMRPAWISGPFASPYSTAVEFDNLILVASGIGITPAMSIITTYKDTRRTNLIWACRDAALLEFYLSKCVFGRESWTLIYYTGKRKLNLAAELPPSVLVFHGRPDLESAVRNMVIGVETGSGLPEDLYEDAEAAVAEAREYHRSLALDGLGASARFDALIRRSLVTYGEADLMQLLTLSFPTPELGREGLCRALNGFFDAEVPPFALDEMDELFARFDADGNGQVSISEVLAHCRHGISTLEARKSTCGVVLARLAAGPSEPPSQSASEPSPSSPRSAREKLSLRFPRSARQETLSPPPSPPPPPGESAPVGNAAGGPRKTSEVIARLAQLTFSPTPAKAAASGQRKGPRRFSTEHRAELQGGDAKSFVSFVGPTRLANWEMLYCGGSQPVVDALKKIENEYGIRLSVEKFDW